ncbi:MAG: hypothetical protein ACXV5L_01995 [Thermoanaerobaculia bacterium]
MKPLAVAILLAASVSAFAIDVNVKRGDRIGVLAISERHVYTTEHRVADALQNYLRDELGTRGFDAFRVEETYDELRRNDRANADYYVEIVSSHGDANVMGAIGVGGGPIAAEVGVVVSHVATELRLYDGRTLELIDRYDLHQRRTNIAPTGIGVGGRSIIGWIALPIFQRAQYRAVTHDVARDAADRIAAGAHGQ